MPTDPVMIEMIDTRNWTDKDWDEHYERINPYRNIGNTKGKNFRQLIIDLGKKLEANEVTDQELVDFFHFHRMVWDNPRTGMLSSAFWEPEYSPDKVRMVCTMSCSCECGPMDDSCNQLGPGSKINFSFKKEEK
jgi:hypothetical protein